MNRGRGTGEAGEATASPKFRDLLRRNSDIATYWLDEG